MNCRKISFVKGILGMLAGAALAGAASTAAATVVLIKAGPGGNGCTSCFGGPSVLGSGPGMVVTLVNDSGQANQLSLAAGTYSITNAATSGFYSAWRYDSGADDWAWNFVIGADNGNNTATVVEVGSIGGLGNGDQSYVAEATDVPTMHFTSVIDPHGSTAGFSDTLTLTKTTLLDFFVVDGYLPDNDGGVALDIKPLAAVPEPASWALLVGGFGVVGHAMRRRAKVSVSKKGLRAVA